MQVYLKRLCLMLLLHIIVSNVFAQTHDPVSLNAQRRIKSTIDSGRYRGYMITIQLPPNSKSYGFDISKDDEMVGNQFKNPLPFAINGIRTKEDAYKVAQWIIDEHSNTGHWQHTMPPHIAKRLKIECN